MVNQSFVLEDALLIGAADDCDIRIDDESVAGHHARISLTGSGEVTIEALNDGVSLRVNGADVHSMPLAGGDEIRIGTARFMLQAPGLRPGRILTEDAVKQKTRAWPWLLALGIMAALALAFRYGAIERLLG
jgi:pSer/pThr/pTyr-binding forkhead associated (FHA) protein